MATDCRATPEVVDAFAAATVTVFQELAGTAVALRESAVAAAARPAADICAAIELRRRSPGLLICAFPAAVAESLARRSLPPDVTLTPDILDDAAGEFANVIAGQAKTMLKGTPYHYALSIPAVTRGRCMAQPALAGGTALHFDCDVGRFCVWVLVAAEGPS